MSIDLILQNNDNLRPRDEIKVEKITASPFPDRRRVKVTVDITPFRERPNLEIAIEDRSGKSIAGTSAIALMNFTTSYVLHLRGIDDPAGQYTVRVQLYYESPDAIQHTRESALHIPAQTPDGDAPDQT